MTLRLVRRRGPRVPAIRLRRPGRLRRVDLVRIACARGLVGVVIGATLYDFTPRPAPRRRARPPLRRFQ
jgi:hypothetical protein